MDTAAYEKNAIQGEQVLSQLRLSLSNTLNIVQRTNNWLASSGGKEAAMKYLQVDAPKAINTLAAVLKSRVLAGDAAYPMSRWVADANELGKTIASFGKDAEGYSSWAIVTATASATGQQIASGAEAALDKATPALGFVALGLGAIAVIVVMK